MPLHRSGPYTYGGRRLLRPKERPSFLKKRSKKLLFLKTCALTENRQDAKVFWFFFSKKNALLLAYLLAIVLAADIAASICGSAKAAERSST